MVERKRRTGQPRESSADPTDSRDWMEDPEAVQRLHKAFEKHVVLLHVAYDPGDGGQPQLLGLTGGATFFL